jgi:hypothetical protein
MPAQKSHGLSAFNGQSPGRTSHVIPDGSQSILTPIYLPRGAGATRHAFAKCRVENGTVQSILMRTDVPKGSPLVFRMSWPMMCQYPSSQRGDRPGHGGL